MFVYYACIAAGTPLPAFTSKRKRGLIEKSYRKNKKQLWRRRATSVLKSALKKEKTVKREEGRISVTVLNADNKWYLLWEK